MSKLSGIPCKVLVTGANGFVGSYLTPHLSKQMFDVTAVTRTPEQRPLWGAGIRSASVGEIDANTKWRKTLAGINCVVHLANRSHIMRDERKNPIGPLRRVNVEGTVNLARQAITIGVERFIYISSVKVNGEKTDKNPFTAEDQAAPLGAYGVSKDEAEKALRYLFKNTSSELVIIRPPLIYGPGVEGNFLTMVKLVRLGIPLPFALVRNRRSLVGLDNLVSFIALCITHPLAANQTFLVADQEDMSTAMILKKIGSALDKSVCLLPFPTTVILWLGQLLGRSAMISRLCSSLVVDIRKNRELLNWVPPYSADEQLAKLAEQFNNRNVKE